MEYFTGPPVIAISDLPTLTPVSLMPDRPAGILQRLAFATRKRLFVLAQDWHVTLDKVDYLPQLNGQIRIPALSDSGQPIRYDGASVPLPWLISVLTIGILRPLGVMLIASIVHDYAYKFGHLRKVDSVADGLHEAAMPAERTEMPTESPTSGTVNVPGPETRTDIPISREQADRLFRDMISSVNRLPMVGHIAWLFVRMGWFFRVRYNGQVRGGRPPLLALLIVGLLLGTLVGIGAWVGATTLCVAIVNVYVLAYALSVLIRPDDSSLE